MSRYPPCPHCGLYGCTGTVGTRCEHIEVARARTEELSRWRIVRWMVLGFLVTLSLASAAVGWVLREVMR